MRDDTKTLLELTVEVTKANFEATGNASAETICEFMTNVYDGLSKIHVNAEKPVPEKQEPYTIR